MRLAEVLKVSIAYLFNEQTSKIIHQHDNENPSAYNVENLFQNNKEITDKLIEQLELRITEKEAVINDQVGVINLVLVGHAQSRTVRAYRRGNERFSSGSQPDVLIDDAGAQWTITEDALTAADGRTLARLPGHVAYSFAFDSYFPRGG